MMPNDAIDTIDRLIHDGTSDIAYFEEIFIKHPCPDVMVHLHTKYGTVWDAKTCARAALADNLHLLKYLRESAGCPWDGSTLDYAAWASLACLKYAHTYKCPFGVYMHENAHHARWEFSDWAYGPKFEAAKERLAYVNMYMPDTNESHEFGTINEFPKTDNYNTTQLLTLFPHADY